MEEFEKENENFLKHKKNQEYLNPWFLLLYMFRPIKHLHITEPRQHSELQYLQGRELQDSQYPLSRL